MDAKSFQAGTFDHGFLGLTSRYVSRCSTVFKGVSMRDAVGSLRFWSRIWWDEACRSVTGSEVNHKERKGAQRTEEVDRGLPD